MPAKKKNESTVNSLGFKPYKSKKGEEYMNSKQREHFRGLLISWKKELMEEVDRTVSHMKDEAANFPDPADRATQEEEFSLELRTRDRERKLNKKIDSTIERIEQDDYGFCDTTYLLVNVGSGNPTPTSEEPANLIRFNNHISPDGDGVNDYFMIYGIENLFDYQLTIVDQLGRMVYQSTNYENDWNGAYSNGQVMNGIYFYVLEMQDGKRLSGSVVVIK